MQIVTTENAYPVCRDTKTEDKPNFGILPHILQLPRFAFFRFDVCINGIRWDNIKLYLRNTRPISTITIQRNEFNLVQTWHALFPPRQRLRRKHQA